MATPLTCILCGDFGAVDFLLNILLFVPLGIGLHRLGFSWRRALVLGALLSGGIELLQMKVIVGRDASLGDVLANTLGIGAGVVLSRARTAILHPEPRRARRLAWAWSALLVAVWAGTAWALGPSFPLGGQWYGAWAPDLANYAPFRGRVLMVEAGDEPVLPGGALDQGRFEASILASPTMSAVAIPGPVPRRLAPVGLVVDGDHGNILLLAQDRQDLTFAYRMRASSLKLWNPRINLRNGFSGPSGDTISIFGGVRDNVIEMRSEGGDSVRSRLLPLSASWGWALITPWDSVLGEEVHSLTALWIIGLVSVLAYWTLLARGPALAIVPVTIVILLGAIPYAAGFPPVRWSEWAAALLGAGIGALAAQRVAVTGPHGRRKGGR